MNLELLFWACLLYTSGPYSVPAGLWKNKMQSGYTEHLMRKARIPLEEYKKELILPFNPTEFDAEEWMRHASDGYMANPS